MDVQKQKAQLREDIRHRLRDLSPADRAAESRSLCRRLREILPPDLSVLAGFFPLGDEPDILPFLIELRGKGCRMFLPRFEGGVMAFREAQMLDRLPRGALNIPEPPADAPLLDPSMLSHALIPGRAFDRAGNRLGRGNGGYDHWIAAQRRSSFDKLRMTSGTVFWGVCFEYQLVQAVPVHGHDQAVDAVVTARGLMTV